jgi:lipoprotein-anchoring transpeptidase ErfK/SrfK
MSTITTTATTTSRGARPGTAFADSRRAHVRAVAAAVLSAAVLITGCGRADPAPSTDATPAVQAVVDTPDASAGTASDDAAVAARVDGEIAVYDEPGADAPARTLPATTDFGTPTVVLVTQIGAGPSEGWAEVLLPVRPNGSTGWIRSDDVELHDITLEVEVDLEARRLTVRDDGEELLSTATAIGDPEHPTPTGRFYVVDKLQSPNPGGAYGPFAMGLSAYSNVLTEFAGGDGQVGIHGTNAPASVGQPVSHGCMRVDNAVITELTDILPLGTPVTIS